MAFVGIDVPIETAKERKQITSKRPCIFAFDRFGETYSLKTLYVTFVSVLKAIKKIPFDPTTAKLNLRRGFSWCFHTIPNHNAES